MKPLHMIGKKQAFPWIFLFVLIPTVVSLASNCGNNRTRVGRPPNNEVWIAEGAFQPFSKDVVPGTRVTWINRDSAPHRITSGITDYDGLFDSGEISPGGSFSFTFYDVGVYQYFCSLHPGTMQGTVIVGVRSRVLPF